MYNVLQEQLLKAGYKESPAKKEKKPRVNKETKKAVNRKAEKVSSKKVLAFDLF